MLIYADLILFVFALRYIMHNGEVGVAGIYTLIGRNNPSDPWFEWLQMRSLEWSRARFKLLSAVLRRKVP